eukprot:scaffold53132_cov36-Phaeocystis_antarctica.AAC.1
MDTFGEVACTERSRAGGSHCATPTEKCTQRGFFPSRKRSCGTGPCAPNDLRSAGMNVHARPRWSASVFPDVDDDGSTGAFVGRMSLNAARSELETAGERQREIDGFMA